MTSLRRVCSVLAEMQKTEYMVFAGRQYFLGDKCQVTLAAAHAWDASERGVSCCHPPSFCWLFLEAGHTWC